MGEIILFDKAQAEKSSTLGFKYTTRNTDGKTVYVFTQSKELMTELNSKFEKGSFFIDKTLKF